MTAAILQGMIFFCVVFVFVSVFLDICVSSAVGLKFLRVSNEVEVDVEFVSIRIELESFSANEKLEKRAKKKKERVYFFIMILRKRVQFDV